MHFRLPAALAILFGWCVHAGAQTANFSASLPNLSPSVRSTGVPGLDGGHWFIWNQPAAFDGTATFRVDRHIKAGSGQRGATYQTILAKSSNHPNDAGYEWTITAEQNNFALASVGAENVAVNGTIVKRAPTNTVATTGVKGDGKIATVTFAGDATMPLGHTVVIAGLVPAGYNGAHKITASAPGSVSFASSTTGLQSAAGTIVDTSVGYSAAMNGNCIETSAESDPVGPCIGAEFDVTLHGAGVTTDAHKQRVGVQIQANAEPKTSGSHAGRGLLIGTGGGAIFDRGVDFGGSFGVGVDFTSGNYTTAPIYLPDGKGVLSAGSLELGSAAGASVELQVGGGTAWSVSGAGGGALTPGAAGNRNIGSAAAQVATVYAQDVQLKAYTVATLPACDAGSAGAIAYVTDAAGPSYNGALMGGASTRTLALCNGAVWTAH